MIPTFLCRQVAAHRLGSLLLGLGLLTGAAPAMSQSNPPAAKTGPVVVSGVVPDEATRQAILNKVREVYGREQVVDQLGVANTEAPPNWAENVQKLVTPELKNVHRGQLRIAGNVVDLRGEVDSAAARDRIGSAFSAQLNPTYTVNNQLQVAEAPQARIDNILINKIVEFESSSAVLTPSGREVLDEVIPVLLALDSKKKIQIIGHTDASGSRGANLALSQARANAVRTYLVERNLLPANLLTAGLGPDRPLVANDTPEGRAKNRRIEFRILN